MESFCAIWPQQRRQDRGAPLVQLAQLLFQLQQAQRLGWLPQRL
jgi:hypothetical protein